MNYLTLFNIGLNNLTIVCLTFVIDNKTAEMQEFYL